MSLIWELTFHIKTMQCPYISNMLSHINSFGKGLIFETGKLNDKMHVLNAVDPNEETGSTPTQMPSIK